MNKGQWKEIIACVMVGIVVSLCALACPSSVQVSCSSGNVQEKPATSEKF